MAALSLVSITSHHHLHHSHNTLIINRSKVIARDTPAPPRQHIHGQKHGTRVAVRDLFGNMPVRVKQRVEESSTISGSGREWEELRKLVTSLALAWHSPVLIVVRDAISSQKMRLRGTASLSSSGNNLSEAKLVAHVCNTLVQATLICSPDQSKWVSTRASTPRLRIRGAISKEPAPTKAVQFLCMGIEPLSIQYGHNVLYDEINRLFENSSFGKEDESSHFDNANTKGKHGDRWPKGDNFTIRELRGSRKGFDRWPMFFIQIEFLDPITQVVENGSIDDVVEDKKGSLSSVVELLKAMVVEFLKGHNFRPKFTRSTHISQNRASESARTTSERGARAGRGNEQGPQFPKQFQAQRTGSPFDTWSRVKSGRPKPRPSIPELLHQPRSQVHNGEVEIPMACESTSKIDVCSSLSSGQDSPSWECNIPTIARSGKLIRPPFGSVLPLASKTVSAPPPVENDLSVPDSYRENGGEECLNFIDPITKMGSLVNSRTGLVTQSPRIDRLTPRIVSYLEPGIQRNFPVVDHLALTQDTEQNSRSSTWIDGILRNWKNPIYSPTETPIPQIPIDGPGDDSQWLLHGHRHNCTQFDNDRVFRETSMGLDSRISKEALRKADIISQVDSKFILIKISASCASSDDAGAGALKDMLVIVDQHAADERCRVEELLEELCKAPVIDENTAHLASSQSGVLTTSLVNTVSFIMPRREIQLLQMHAQHFADWGIIYEVPHAKQTTDAHHEGRVVVRSLPPSILERCTNVPKLLIELLRKELWKYSERGQKIEAVGIETDTTETGRKHPWLKKIHSCPQALLEMLNSRACRSKINHSAHYMGS